MSVPPNYLFVWRLVQAGDAPTDGKKRKRGEGGASSEPGAGSGHAVLETVTWLVCEGCDGEVELAHTGLKSVRSSPFVTLASA